ncbi:SGNH/GDSL hydrolase family protein [Paracoccus sp. PAR01]|nr:SGNH/GDSL hydrolase family protein [Paracoccus sp. PAR01]
MMTRLASRAALLAVSIAVGIGAAKADPWTPAWLASPQPVWSADFPLPTGLPPTIAGQVIRQPLTLAWSGDRLRLVLSNIHGTQPLAITAAAVAPADDGARTTGPARVVTFGGRPEAQIAPGASLVSDAVDLPVTAGQRIAATLRFGPDAQAQDFHWDARETSFVLKGGDPTATDPQVAQEIATRIALAGVLVDHPADQVVVAMGDSITDGNGAPMDGQARWPDQLARRLAPQGVAVVNAGISGGRLLTDGMGQSVLARLDSDLLSLPDADALILLIGTNDIAWPGSPFAPDEPPMVLERLQAGYLQLAERLHAQGIRLIVGTLPPFKGALPGTPMEDSYWSADKDDLRNRFNDWLRGADFHDGLVDFDQILRDPAAPARLLEAYDSGDRLHPGAAGNKAMAEGVDIGLLK